MAQDILWREAALKRLGTAREPLHEAVVGVPYLTLTRLGIDKALSTLDRVAGDLRIEIAHLTRQLQSAQSLANEGQDNRSPATDTTARDSGSGASAR
jgi:hypothetical protein